MIERQSARFPLPRTNGGCGFSEETFAQTYGDEDAPKPATPIAAGQRTPSAPNKPDRPNSSFSSELRYDRMSREADLGSRSIKRTEILNDQVGLGLPRPRSRVLRFMVRKRALLGPSFFP